METLKRALHGRSAFVRVNVTTFQRSNVVLAVNP